MLKNLGHSARTYLALSTRAMLAILEATHRTYAPPGVGAKSVFKTLKNALLSGWVKLASKSRSRLSYRETLLVRTALGVAVRAAESHHEDNAVLELRRLKHRLPGLPRAERNQREQQAHVLLRLFVTAGGHLTSVVRELAPGDALEAA